MQNTGQGSEKKSYRVVLLLFVGLVAFSSAMKELNQVRQLTRQANALIAHLTDTVAPAEHFAILAQVQTCERKKSVVPPVPLPVPAVPAVEPTAPEIEVPAVAPTVPRRAPVAPPAKPRRVVRPSQEDAEVRVLFLDELVEKSLRDALQAEETLKAFKAKNRRHQIFITPDGKDVILKSLNRGINLRSAS